VCLQCYCLQCFDTVVGRQEGRPACKKTERWGAGMVICLEQGSDLHMAQRIPLPLTVSCFSKIQIGFTFLVPAHPGSPRQRAVKRMCVCTRCCVFTAQMWALGCKNQEWSTTKPKVFFVCVVMSLDLMMHVSFFVFLVSSVSDWLNDWIGPLGRMSEVICFASSGL